MSEHISTHKVDSLSYSNHLVSVKPNGNTGSDLIRIGAVGSFATSGVLFVLYPLLRPFSDKTSLLGASAFTSTEWIVSHTFAIFAFILLAIGQLGLYLSLQNSAVEKLALRSLVFVWIGVGLTLPFYGVEVFGLNIIGQQAIQQQNDALMSLANEIRFGPGFSMIVAGLMILAIGTILTAVAIWKSRILPKWSCTPIAFGFIMYLPQYMGTQPIRVAHGLVIAIGCLWIAIGLWRKK